MVRHGQYNKLLAAFVLGDLDDRKAALVKAHLAQCAACARETERLERILACTESLGGLSVDDHACRSAGQNVLSAVGNEETIAPCPDRRFDGMLILSAVRNEETIAPRPDRRFDGMLIWRTIMKSRTTKLAMATAAVIAVALVLISPFGGAAVTFAEVIQPILNAHTVVYDMMVGEDEDGPIIHDVVKGSRLRRATPGESQVMVIDLDNGRMLTFNTETKGAAYIDIQGPLQEGTRSYLGLVRDIAVRLAERPDLSVKEFGRKEINGRQAVGFQVYEPYMTLTIWADAETRLPVRIELLRGQAPIILKNIEFDVTVDDAQVSMEAPPGYTVADTQFDMTKFSEEDFVETLRLWVELVLDGSFPERLKLEDLMEAPIDVEQLDLPAEEIMQLGTRVARGYMFLHVLAQGDGYEYVGKGVKLGDADKAVFWYRPQGSDTHRVIYGDLSVRDVALEDLPQ